MNDSNLNTMVENESSRATDRLLPYFSFGFMLIGVGIIIGVLIHLRNRSIESFVSLEIQILYLLIVISVISVVVSIHIVMQRTPIRKDAIPSQDRVLLEALIKSSNVEGINQYVRLTSLTGRAGVATQIGLTGLPLATIMLTIFFSLFAAYGSNGFLDLVKLTLGAFIGSFVQKASSIAKQSNDIH